MNGRDANDLVAMPVIATTAGAELGRVKDVLFDPDGHCLLGLMVTPASGTGSVLFVDHDSIRGIGSSAVTVDDAASLQELSQQTRAQEIIDSGLHLRGANVVTETGNSLGTVDKVLIDDMGNVAAYHASSGLLGLGEKTDIAPSEVISIGKDAIVVGSGIEQRKSQEYRDDAMKNVEAKSKGSVKPGGTRPTGAHAAENASSDDTMRTNNPDALTPD